MLAWKTPSIPGGRPRQCQNSIRVTVYTAQPVPTRVTSRGRPAWKDQEASNTAPAIRIDAAAGLQSAALRDQAPYLVLAVARGGGLRR